MCYTSQDFREGISAFLAKRAAEMDRHVAVSVGVFGRQSQSTVGSQSRSAVAVGSRESCRRMHLQRGAWGTSCSNGSSGMHGGRQRRAGEEEAHRADERQVPVAGRVDDESEREGRQDGRER